MQRAIAPVQSLPEIKASSSAPLGHAVFRGLFFAREERNFQSLFLLVLIVTMRDSRFGEKPPSLLLNISVAANEYTSDYLLYRRLPKPKAYVMAGYAVRTVHGFSLKAGL
jgi:hypothetical protein